MLEVALQPVQLTQGKSSLSVAEPLLVPRRLEPLCLGRGRRPWQRVPATESLVQCSAVGVQVWLAQQVVEDELEDVAPGQRRRREGTGCLERLEMVGGFRG